MELKGLTAIERGFIEDFYKKQPNKVQKIQQATEDNTLSIFQKTKKEDLPKTKSEDIISIAEMLEDISIGKLRSLIAASFFTEGEHYILKNKKRKWKKAAKQKITQKFIVNDKDRIEFEKLFLSLTEENGYSLSKFSKILAEKTAESDRSIYSFFYTLFGKKLNKKKVEKYRALMLEMKKEKND